MSLTNCKLIGPVTDPSNYRHQECKRGEPGYVMSYSELKQFAQCPRKWLNGATVERTAEIDFGAVIDCMFLTPEQFTDRFVVCPETYPGPKGEPKPWTFQANYCKEWRKEQEAEGKRVITDDTFSAANLCYLFTCLRDKALTDYINASKTQVAVLGDWSHDGQTIPLRGMIDLVPLKDSPYGKSLGDLKCYQSANPRQWARSVFDHSLHWQAALYLDLYTTATNEDRCEFRHLIVEQNPPYQTGRRILSQEFIDAGRIGYTRALKDYAECLRTGYWPDYETDARGALVIDGWTVTQPENWMMGE